MASCSCWLEATYRLASLSHRRVPIATAALVAVLAAPISASGPELALAGGGLRFPDGSLQQTASEGTAPLRDSGQDSCWAGWAGGGVAIPCKDSGQDGELRRGVSWPTPRFSDNGDGTAQDNLTGLHWLLDTLCLGSLPGDTSWTEALTRVASLNSGADLGCTGYTPGTYADFRLPNYLELESLIDYGALEPALPAQHPFLVDLETYYWSSTTVIDGPSAAWIISLRTGWPWWDGKTPWLSAPKLVWPVRGGSVSAMGGEQIALTLGEGGLRFADGTVQRTAFAGGAQAPVRATGQQGCWDEGGEPISCEGTMQDGDLQAGVPWPSPRFIDQGDGTARDRLTGLVWLRDGGCLERNNWDEAFAKVASLNSGTEMGCLGYVAGTYSDFRVPNLLELRSLVDLGRPDPNIAGAEPFFGLRSEYWTSDTYPDSPTVAWYVDLRAGFTSVAQKWNDPGVWPVRGGH